VEAIVSKAKEGNIQASKLLIETAFGTAASMATLEEKEQVRMSIFSPELLEEWRKEAELAGVVFSEPDESSAETPPGTNGPE
jgi:hypothetical protein